MSSVSKDMEIRNDNHYYLYTREEALAVHTSHLVRLTCNHKERFLLVGYASELRVYALRRGGGLLHAHTHALDGTLAFVEPILTPPPSTTTATRMRRHWIVFGTQQGTLQLLSFNLADGATTPDAPSFTTDVINEISLNNSLYCALPPSAAIPLITHTHTHIYIHRQQGIVESIRLLWSKDCSMVSLGKMAVNRLPFLNVVDMRALLGDDGEDGCGDGGRGAECSSAGNANSDSLFFLHCDSPNHSAATLSLLSRAHPTPLKRAAAALKEDVDVKVEWSFDGLPVDAYALRVVVGDGFGVLVYAPDSISFFKLHPSASERRMDDAGSQGVFADQCAIAIQPSQFQAIAPIDGALTALTKTQRWLQSDYNGNLWLLVLLWDGASAAAATSSLSLQWMGRQASSATCITYIDDGLVWLGSKWGDSAILRLCASRNSASGGFTEIAREFPSLGPMLDFCFMAGGDGDDAKRKIAGVCGVYGDASSLRVLCAGSRFTTTHTLPCDSADDSNGNDARLWPGVSAIFINRLASCSPLTDEGGDEEVHLLSLCVVGSGTSQCIIDLETLATKPYHPSKSPSPSTSTSSILLASQSINNNNNSSSSNNSDQGILQIWQDRVVVVAKDKNVADAVHEERVVYQCVGAVIENACIGDDGFAVHLFSHSSNTNVVLAWDARALESSISSVKQPLPPPPTRTLTLSPLQQPSALTLDTTFLYMAHWHTREIHKYPIFASADLGGDSVCLASFRGQECGGVSDLCVAECGCCLLVGHFDGSISLVGCEVEAANAILSTSAGAPSTALKDRQCIGMTPVTFTRSREGTLLCAHSSQSTHIITISSKQQTAPSSGEDKEDGHNNISPDTKYAHCSIKCKIVDRVGGDGGGGDDNQLVGLVSVGTRLVDNKQKDGNAACNSKEMAMLCIALLDGGDDALCTLALGWLDYQSDLNNKVSRNNSSNKLHQRCTAIGESLTATRILYLQNNSLIVCLCTLIYPQQSTIPNPSAVPKGKDSNFGRKSLIKVWHGRTLQCVATFVLPVGEHAHSMLYTGNYSHDDISNNGDALDVAGLLPGNLLIVGTAISAENNSNGSAHAGGECTRGRILTFTLPTTTSISTSNNTPHTNNGDDDASGLLKLASEVNVNGTVYGLDIVGGCRLVACVNGQIMLFKLHSNPITVNMEDIDNSAQDSNNANDNTCNTSNAFIERETWKQVDCILGSILAIACHAHQNTIAISDLMRSLTILEWDPVTDTLLKRAQESACRWLTGGVRLLGDGRVMVADTVGNLWVMRYGSMNRASKNRNVGCSNVQPLQVEAAIHTGQVINKIQTGAIQSNRNLSSKSSHRAIWTLCTAAGALLQCGRLSSQQYRTLYCLQESINAQAHLASCRWRSLYKVGIPTSNSKDNQNTCQEIIDIDKCLQFMRMDSSEQMEIVDSINSNSQENNNVSLKSITECIQEILSPFN